MPRAEACFKKAGFEKMTTFTTDHFTGNERNYHFDQWLIPNESVLTDWSRLLHEIIGYLVYAMMGYL
ncbi:MAG: hypothetical protein JNJ99_14495 [Crocinitomicaceae bacterium]|nr:hypothetical protein [Crocinitomicaceae bacterium]